MASQSALFVDSITVRNHLNTFATTTNSLAEVCLAVHALVPLTPVQRCHRILFKSLWAFLLQQADPLSDAIADAAEHFERTQNTHKVCSLTALDNECTIIQQLPAACFGPM